MYHLVGTNHFIPASSFQVNRDRTKSGWKSGCFHARHATNALFILKITDILWKLNGYGSLHFQNEQYTFVSADKKWETLAHDSSKKTHQFLTARNLIHLMYLDQNPWLLCAM